MLITGHKRLQLYFPPILCWPSHLMKWFILVCAGHNAIQHSRRISWFPRLSACHGSGFHCSSFLSVSCPTVLSRVVLVHSWVTNEITHLQSPLPSSLNSSLSLHELFFWGETLPQLWFMPSMGHERYELLHGPEEVCCSSSQ